MSVKNYERKKDTNTNTDTIKNMNNSQYLDCGGGEIWNIRISNIERKLQNKDKIANTDTRKYNYKEKQLTVSENTNTKDKQLKILK